MDVCAVRQHIYIWNNAAGLNDDGLVNILYKFTHPTRVLASPSQPARQHAHHVVQAENEMNRVNGMSECVKR